MIDWLTHKLGLSSCPECETLVEYAMDGLPEGQQDAVRQHLEDCPPCREQVRDYWQVREGLALCAKQQDAPPDLCSKVLAKLNHEGDGKAPAGAAVPPTAVPPVPRRTHLGGWPRFWMLLGPVFAVLSLVMTAVAVGALFGTKPATASAADNELTSIANALMSDPQAARVELAAAGPSAQASGLLVVCPGMDHAYFHCDHLSRCPLGSNYVLWMKPQRGEPRRLARFAVEKDGSSVHLLLFSSAFKASGPVEFTVTQESGGESSGQAWLKGSVRL
jgi:hypothetical protein